MVPTIAACQKSSLYLNEHVTSLQGPPASFFIHYWGGKPRHRGNMPHAHSFFEICYVAEGVGTYVHNGITYPLRQGTLYCSKPNSSHHIESEDGMLLLFVAFDLIQEAADPQVVQTFERLKRFHHMFIADAEQSAAVLTWKALIAYCSGEAIDYPMAAEKLAHSLLLTSLSMFSRYSESFTAEHATEPVYSGALKEAKDYIMNHLSNKLTLKELAQEIHLSERQLSRLLSEQLGLTFPSWVRNERIKRAAYLLVYTDINIEDISSEVGFETVHYFSKVFADLMNITPAKFRKSVRSNELDFALLHRYLQAAVNRSLS
ncbi:helix-turn-helix domain-containing protein [Paenibacillus allorhizosphaerae]|uniref:HTH-type transcriptional activator RhaR n=1 Tax=Paenibacillus allorhizosphaerae TaxID=2849866 RepID=A0ABM8VA39_9BACL|nr:AraC family transcriptional regulator [Paenibacillus allorhizosphaerae]CAG7615378.1 HTH-type transcriptional activator RhaR [Paenibacillus allorhizosphaerae]